MELAHSLRPRMEFSGQSEALPATIYDIPAALKGKFPHQVRHQLNFKVDSHGGIRTRWLTMRLLRMSRGLILHILVQSQSALKTRFGGTVQEL